MINIVRYIVKYKDKIVKDNIVRYKDRISNLYVPKEAIYTKQH